MFTRIPSDYSAGRRPWTVIVVVGLAIYLLLTAAGTLWTDFLWFDSMGFTNVWLRNWGLSIVLGTVGVAVSFLVIWAALKLVDRFTPRWAPFDLTDEEELVERFREWVEPRLRQVRLAVTGGLALIMGLTVATLRDQMFLFLNSRPFGDTDPIFDTDIGFYVFRLPLWESVVDWVFNLLVLTTVLVAVALYLNGAIRFNGRRVTATRGAKIYLSALFAVVALIRAVTYRLDMYELLYADRNGIFFGPGFTDINARLPAIRLLLVVALIAAALFIINIFRRGWTLAVVSVGSWIVVAIAAGAIYPAFIQRFSVLPDQRDKETEFITHNMAATKEAWVLDEVEVRSFSATPNLTAADIEENRITIDNLRIWSTSVLPRTYQNFQELEPYYTLQNVDTDRYISNDGTPNQVMLAVRELDEPELPATDWQNQRLFYTHGFGAVVNQANVVQNDGQPVFLLQDVPPVAAEPVFELEEPRIYFGQTYETGRPVIVRTGSIPQEIDFPLATGTGFNEYEGDAGVVLDNFFKRIAFAFRYRDLNLLISNQIRPDSRVLVERNIMGIVDQVAPFLSADADPYPVILDGEIKWVLDMYTTTSFYPYSQPIDSVSRERLALNSRLDLGVNYVRNSVKAVIDANNGDVNLYVFDTDDPIVNTWAAVHPELFVDGSTMPDRLEHHLRYPQDLFRIQSHIYLRYHVNQENQLFSGNDEWSFPGDPSTPGRTGNARLYGDFRSADGSPMSQIMPYYLLTELPGETELSYLLLQPFNPRARRNMVSFLVADSTPGEYGRLVDFRMPEGALVDGAEQAGQRIEQDADIAQQLSLWRGEGSNVIKGDLLIVPIENSVLYVQPIFLEEDGGAFPEFRRVAVVFADRVEWADTLNGAFELVFGIAEDEPGDGDGDGGELPPGEVGTIEELIAEAEDAFANAEAALRAGDLANYQRWVNEAQRILEELAGLVDDVGPNAWGSHLIWD
ncbi:MAG TPA: UPF0182 family protein [Acidimicrobiia bacterium]|nr:UPF0182 family protein [Acidimicrobiia bacterium]